MKNELLDKVVVWENPDGSLATTYFVKDAKLVEVFIPEARDYRGGIIREETRLRTTMEYYTHILKNELTGDETVSEVQTDDEFVQVEILKLRERPEFSNLNPLIKSIRELPKSDKRKWRLNNKKEVFVDLSVETIQENEDKKKEIAKQEILSKGFSKETASRILRENADASID